MSKTEWTQEEKTGFPTQFALLRPVVHFTPRQDAEPHPLYCSLRRGAKKPCTGLRHRPEKGGEGETPGRRASRVASAPNPRAKATTHTHNKRRPRGPTQKLPRRRRRVPPDVLRVRFKVSVYLSPSPWGHLWDLWGRSRPSTPSTWHSNTVVIPALLTRPPGRRRRTAPRASSGG